MTLACIESGTGSPILLLHGLLGSKANMTGLAKGLQDRFRVLVCDLRNHGESFHHPSMSYSEMAGDIASLLDRKDISSATLIGHSLGGKCSMQFAAMYPERIDRLIVLDIAPRHYRSLHWLGYVQAMAAMDLRALRSRKEADSQLEKTIPSPVYRSFLLSNLITTEQGSYRWRVNLEAILRSSEQIAAPISFRSPSSCPAVFVRGGNSKYIRDEDIEKISSCFPDSRLITIEGSGHLVHIERKERLLQLLVDLL